MARTVRPLLHDEAHLKPSTIERTWPDCRLSRVAVVMLLAPVAKLISINFLIVCSYLGSYVLPSSKQSSPLSGMACWGLLLRCLPCWLVAGVQCNFLTPGNPCQVHVGYEGFHIRT